MSDFETAVVPLPPPTKPPSFPPPQHHRILATERCAGVVCTTLLTVILFPIFFYCKCVKRGENGISICTCAQNLPPHIGSMSRRGYFPRGGGGGGGVFQGMVAAAAVFVSFCPMQTLCTTLATARGVPLYGCYLGQ